MKNQMSHHIPEWTVGPIFILLAKISQNKLSETNLLTNKKEKEKKLCEWKTFKLPGS